MILLAFLIPLAIYFLLLAFVNRRNHPVLIPGAWDFAGVLFAASGFLLVGGPAVLTSLHEQWRMSWLLGRVHYLREVAEHWPFWIGSWIVYFVAAVGGAIFMLRRRRCLTAIYNIDPAVIEGLMARVFEQLGLDVARLDGRRLHLRNRRKPPAAEADQGVGLEIEAFPALQHVTLRWGEAKHPVRHDVETELRRALASVQTAHNPARNWFLTVGLGLITLGAATVVFFLALHATRIWLTR